MAKSKRPRREITPLAKRKFKKGVIESPFKQLQDMAPFSWSSWKDEHLPNMLWAAVCVGSLERETALNLFREICHAGSIALKGNRDATLGHNFLSTLEFEQFSALFAPIKRLKEAFEACRVLSSIESLPDNKHWNQFFHGADEADDAWPLISGIACCLDHQSQEATDVRWAKVYFMIVCDRVRAPYDFIQNVAQYPHRGEMRAVRPHIRAFEMTLRNFESGSERPDHVPAPQPEAFWNEMMEKTACVRAKRAEASRVDSKITRESLLHTLEAICDHFMDNVSTSGVDARLDGAFGLAINMLTLALEVSISPSNNFATGRIILRTIVESYITLKYLSEKDDHTIWMQYRNYGTGQTALAYIKNVFSEEVPDSIDMTRLEILANEDAWHETKDIVVGNWATLDLRKMATDAGVKDLYDNYYDWTSGFVHGNWGAVRDSSFTICMNPLHRLHRIPAPGNPMPSVLSDCCKICNRALDDINTLFPTFKPKVDWKTDAERLK
jgi:hypothetical protein